MSEITRLPRFRAHAILIAGLALAACGPGGKEPDTGAAPDARTAPADSTAAPAAGPPGSTTAAWSNAGMVEMSFDVDPALLGFTIEDSTLGIRLTPPRGWPPLTPGQFEQVRSAIDQVRGRDSQFTSTPVRIFYEPERRLFLIAAYLPNWPAVLEPLAGLHAYRKRLDAIMPDVQIHDALYRLGPIGVYQLQISNEIMLNLRLFLLQDGRSPVQVDYLMPRSVYPLVAKAVEASIGSIQPL